MNEHDILKWAVKGIKAEIESLEKEVKQGYKYIEQIEKGEKPKTPKSKAEILEICQNKKAEIEKLDKQRFELSWMLDVDLKE